MLLIKRLVILGLICTVLLFVIGFFAFVLIQQFPLSQSLLVGLAVIWLLLLGFIGLGFINIYRLMHSQQHTENPLKQLNGALEQRVAQANTILEHQDEERIQAESALASERNLLRAIIDALPDLIWVKDTHSRIVLVNQAGADLHHLNNPNDLIGKTDFDLHPAELAAKYFADEQAFIQSGKRTDTREDIVIDAAGEKRWMLTTRSLWRDAEGRVLGMIGWSRDITASKQTEEALARERN